MVLPAHARLFSLKLNIPSDHQRSLEPVSFQGMNDIIKTLKNWRKNKDSVSFEDLAQNWIKNNASTPEMKCQANFYRGYSFAFQFMSNLEHVNLSKAKSRQQLMNLVNGRLNVGKSTFLAVASKQVNNMNTYEMTSTDSLDFSTSSSSVSVESQGEFTVDESNQSPLEVMKQMITGKYGDFF